MILLWKNKWKWIFIFKNGGRPDKYKYNLNLPESEEYETIAGLFLSLHEDIPEKGERIDFDDKTILIDSVDEKSIKLIRIFIE